MLKAWDRISDAFDKGEVVEGMIMSRVKGGLSVDIGVRAFLPGSQVALRPVRQLEKLIGEKFPFKIIKFSVIWNVEGLHSDVKSGLRGSVQELDRSMGPSMRAGFLNS